MIQLFYIYNFNLDLCGLSEKMRLLTKIFDIAFL